jgi:hypothetical protein
MLKNACFIGLIFILISCNSNKKQALTYLEKAQTHYEQAEYELAKSTLDSLKIRFPKELEVRKKGLELNRRIETKVHERNLFFCDSLLNLLLAEAEVMKSGFLFEKDPEYDELGKYVEKSQRLENKLQRSYIRTGVNENGELLLSSVYYGSHPIHHSCLKVFKATGDSAETQIIPYDGGMNYSFVDLGMTSEIVTYAQGKDNGVIRFIYDNNTTALKAEYLGQKKYVFTLSSADKNALVKTVDFAVILSDISKLKKEKEKSLQRLKYLNTL